jgi:hypothetical protein
MRTAHESIHIEAPPGAVFDFMCDVEQAPRWRYLLTRMEVIDERPIVSGSKFRIHFESEGRTRSQEIVLAVSERPSRQVWINDSEGFHVEVRFSLMSESSGTRVDLDVNVSGQRLSTKLLVPLVTRSHRNRYAGVLQRLKQAVETG